MENIVNLVSGFRIGGIQIHKNLAIAPLIGESSSLDYLVLKDAVNNGFEVKENPNGASVPELYVVNRTGKKVLAIQGEYVVGGGQNRTFTRNVYFDESFKGEIPVRCVEAGRWNPMNESHTPPVEESIQTPSVEDYVPGVATPAFASAGMVPRSLARAESQTDTWVMAANYLETESVMSASSDVGENYRSRKEDFDRFKEKFSVVEGQIGMVTAYNGGGRKLFVSDVFDRNYSLKKYFSGILESFILDSGLDSDQSIDLSEQEARGFLGSVDTCKFVGVTPISLGNDYRIEGEGLQGFSLFYERGLLYANLFTSSNEDSSRQTSTSVQTGFRRTIG